MSDEREPPGGSKWGGPPQTRGEGPLAAGGAVVTDLLSADRRSQLRMLEAMLFASAEPVSEAVLTERLPDIDDVPGRLRDLQAAYGGRGVQLREVAGGWAFRTAPDLAFLLQKTTSEPRRLTRAALETLAIVAYHQPVTRANIEDIRGVSVAKGTIDVLMETGWITISGRRQTPGRPVTYGTTAAFLDHFGLVSLKDLPGVRELQAAGFFDPVPAGEPPTKAGDDPDAPDQDDEDD